MELNLELNLELKLIIRVQMHWSGAYEGYGTGSLDRDVLEMRSLVKHLRENGECQRREEWSACLFYLSHRTHIHCYWS
jgi:hypothetical protein